VKCLETSQQKASDVSSTGIVKVDPGSRARTFVSVPRIDCRIEIVDQIVIIVVSSFV